MGYTVVEQNRAGHLRLLLDLLQVLRYSTQVRFITAQPWYSRVNIGIHFTDTRHSSRATSHLCDCRCWDINVDHGIEPELDPRYSLRPGKLLSV